jgi:hypothetical protein
VRYSQSVAIAICSSPRYGGRVLGSLFIESEKGIR